MNILIVDDSRADTFIIRNHLDKILSNHTVLTAERASDAIGIISKNHNLDFIFIDYLLPNSTGIDILKKIYNRKGRLRAMSNNYAYRHGR